MDRLLFHKSFYEAELNNRDNLEKAINNPILISIVIFGILSFISQKIIFVQLSKIDIILIVLIVICFILLCISI